MTHRTARPTTTAGPTQLPVDVDTMRACVRRLLAENAAPVDADEAEMLQLQLRGHIGLLIPEVEKRAAKLPYDSIPRYCALACIGEARRKLQLRSGTAPGQAEALARRLARVVGALCDHYENLSAKQR